MHNDLPALAAKIGGRLSISSEYVVTQPAELRVLREISEDELCEFATNHDGAARLRGGQLNFADAAPRPATEPTNVVRNFEESDSDSF